MATRIVLCMIVKDEAAVLQRCLDHVLPVIDAACVCDTGSGDGTPELAEVLLTTAGIPYEIHRHAWVNFGVNRTQSFVASRALAQRLEWDLDRSYALFLDADLLLEVGTVFNPALLEADAYLLQQQDGAIRYDTLTLAKLSLDWVCHGATHEYWAAEGAGPAQRLETLALLHLGDGGTKHDKFSRDIELLERELWESSDNRRTLFYLARSYEDTGRYEEARRLYRLRAGAGGWEEEAWYAAYRSGLCSLQLGEWDCATGELLAAWDRRPQRAEPLYHLARAAREREAWHLAMLVAERALRIPRPDSDTLFVELPAHGEGPLEEISISAFYAGDRRRGAAACEALLHSRTTSPAARGLAGSNVTHYAAPLQTDSFAPLEIPAQLRRPGYLPGNATIQRTAEGFLVINRLHNYSQEGAIMFASHDHDGHIRTKNVSLWLDGELRLVEAREIDDGLLSRLAPHETKSVLVHGLEDMRLARWHDAWWFTAGSWAFGPPGHPSVVLGRLDESGTSVEHLVPLDYAARQPNEKNWLPFVHDDRLLLLYSCDPTVILEPEPETGVCRDIHRAIPDANLDRYRGSAAPVRVGDGYLFTVHEVPMVNGRRVYLHRFVQMDSELTIRRASRLFSFWHTGVEYSCGLCLNHTEDTVVIVGSLEDRESWMVTVPLDQVERMLVPIDSLARGDTAGLETEHVRQNVARSVEIAPSS